MPAEICGENCRINRYQPQSWKETKTLSWSGFEQERLQVGPLGHPEGYKLLLVWREEEHHSGVVGGERRKV